jgi:mono/diheme cytochrome c family protein
MESSLKVPLVLDRRTQVRGFRRADRRPARWLAGAAVVVFSTLAARAEPTYFQARVAPIFDQHCAGCHGETKQKAGLRLDSFELALRGGDDGAVITPGDAKGSELMRRISLPPDDEDRMPSDGKPALSADEIKVIELWIAAGASPTRKLGEFIGAPIPVAPPAPTIPLAPDWQPRAAAIAEFEKSTGIRLMPRSQIATDGLVLRTASEPSHCDDAAIAKLAPLADLVVEAELARTRISDAALISLAACANLRALDLTRTAITSDGLAALTALQKLESLNLTSTAVDDPGLARLKALPALKHVWTFGTKVTAENAAAAVAAK